ncbi:MAG TPA: ribonuclease III [Dehalococcoidia bacterium]|nr:ribonuclease III [Dehalococcoidia bacterium]
MKTQAKPVEALGQELRLRFNDMGLLRLAMIHRSYLNEAPEENLESNERLEFLGDAVLGLVVSEELFRAYPHLAEGHLSQIRAHLVRWDTLAAIANRLSLGDYLILGRGEELSGGRERPSNLAGALEALIGAIYLDAGLGKAKRFILQVYKPELERIAEGEVVTDSKSRLQQVVQSQWHQVPIYHLVSAEGPDHDRVFTVEVLVNQQVLGRGQGRNKKQAEINAAREALERLPKAN